MVHTAEFYIILKEEEAIKIIDKIKSESVFISNFGTIIVKKLLIGNEYNWRTYIYIDFIKLLGRAEIVEGDIDEILEKINSVMHKILKRNFDLYLMRLDYRFDAIIRDAEERRILLKLLNKNKIKASYMRKIDKYKSSVRYYSKSRSHNIYDKESERIAKNKKIENYEKNILRFEAQIKSEHIKYNNKKYSIEKELKVYFTHEKYKRYMEMMVINITTTQDYYSLYYAKKIIEKSNIKDKDKDTLIEFLKYTSTKRSLSLTCEKYGRYKYNKYMAILKTLDINPIIIPEKDKLKYIRNPLKDLV